MANFNATDNEQSKDYTEKELFPAFDICGSC